MKGQCRLFGTSEVLRESHIYPAFAVDYLKRTGSKYLRTFTRPNVRQQDGNKIRLLSHDAEQRFSKKEKWFAEKIFTPYLEGEGKSFDYDENLFYFALSFLWRVLILHTDFTPKLKEDWCYPKLLEVENEWSKFLSKYQFPRHYHHLQLLLTDRVKSIDAEVKYPLRQPRIAILKRRSHLCPHGK